MLSSKTLKPSSMDSLSGLSSLPRRRSHLDSASYRTISRIFSLCRELSRKPQIPEPHAEVESLKLAVEEIDSVENKILDPDATSTSGAVENRTIDAAKSESCKSDIAVEALRLVSEKFNSVKPQNPNPDATLCSVDDKDRSTDLDILDNSRLDETVQASQLVSEKTNSLEFQKPNPSATLNSVANKDHTSDPDKTVNKLDDTVEALQLVVQNIDSMDEVEIDVSSNNERLNSMVSDLFLLVGDPINQTQSGLGEFSPDGQMRDGKKDQKLSLEGELNLKKDQDQQMEVENISIQKIETSNDANEIEQLGVEEMPRPDLCNVTVEVGFLQNNLSQDIGENIQLEAQNEISILGSSNQDKFNASIEEGEITDDAQDLVNESDLDNKFEPLIDDESEDDLVDMRSDEELATNENMPGLEQKKVASQNQGYYPSEVVGVVGKKRKRVRSGRKESKKRAYRIRRAQKLREDGVKRLRLPPPVKKEKEKKICKYYLQGKCQLGSQCKFSHDVTPLTKSKACIHFARDECLKGDECPYDHDLSKYPCHKFVSEGMCIRGANCKFSHNIQHTEDVSALTKEPGKELPDKSNMRKQTNASQKSSTAKFTVVDPVNNLKPGLHKPFEAPVKVPKGMQFLSLGSVTKPEKHNDCKPSNEQKPCLMDQNPLNDPNKERENLSTQAARVSVSSKLLETPDNFEEFMFGGLSASI